MATKIRGAQIRVAYAGPGLSVSGSVMSVNVDGSSLEISTDTLQVKALGITNAMLGGSITDAKLDSVYSLADGTRDYTGIVSYDAAKTFTLDAQLVDKNYVDTEIATFSGAHDEHNELLNIQGGATNDYYHLTSTRHTDLTDGGDTTLHGHDHDGLTNFVADEHVAHSTVSISSGGILLGGGTIDSNQTITLANVDIDHGGISGLTDDDHTMYIKASGNRAFTGTVSGVDPTVSAHLTTKSYVDTQDSAISGSLQTDIIWEIVDTPTTQIRPKIAHLSKAIYTEGNVTIGGDLTVTGTVFYSNTETVQVADNTMVLNYGEAGAGVQAGEAGIQIDRGSEIDYLFVFDEGTDTFRVGVSGVQETFNTAELQPVATREDAPGALRVPWWDDTNKTMRTQGDTFITVNSGTNTLAGSANNTNVFSMTDTSQRVGVAADTNMDISQSADTITFEAANTTELTIGTGGIALKSSTVDVNEILNTTDVDSIDASSTDDQLATAKLIYNHVNTVSGAMVHNELEGLQGGIAGQYYHLDSSDYTDWATNRNEVIQDIVGPMVSGTQTNITVTYQDSSGDIDFVVTTATTAVLGVASFDSADFDVATGAVTLEDTVLKAITTDTGALTIASHAISILGNDAQGIDVDHSGTTITVGGQDATAGVGSGNKGVASFDSDGFVVTNGHVTISATSSGVASSYAADTGTAVPASGVLNIFGGEGMDTSATGNTVTIAGEDASDTNKGIASFNADDFTVTTGNVVIAALGVDNAQLANSSLTVTAGTGLGTGGSVSLGGSVTLDVNVDDSTIEIPADTLQVKDSGITEAKLNMANAPVDQYYLQYTTASGMQWTDVEVTSAVTESDIQLENESANCNGVTTAFTLSYTPVANSLQVFLNGLLQEKGGGNDYTLSGVTVTFVVAPETNDLLIIHYVAIN